MAMLSIWSIYLTSVFSQRRVDYSTYFQGEEALGSVNQEGKGQICRDSAVLAQYPWINPKNQVPIDNQIPKFHAARTWIWIFQEDFQDCLVV